MNMPNTIEVLLFAKINAVVLGFLGLILGLLYSVGGLVIDILVSNGNINSNETSGLGIGTLLAFGAIIGMPFLFSLIGFFYGIISAFLYNLIFCRIRTLLGNSLFKD
tara:strand:+ start:63 stop:383 length:321 start_codon:yes stop_codon:yes gene_type:complete